MSSGRNTATWLIIILVVVAIAIVFSVAFFQGFILGAPASPSAEAPSATSELAPIEPPVTENSSGTITVITSPQPDASVLGGTVIISGSTTATGPLMHVRVFDLSGNPLFDQNDVPVENNIFKVTAVLNVAVTTTVTIEAFQDLGNERIAHRAIQVNLLPSSSIPTAVPAAAIPTFVSWTGQSQTTLDNTNILSNDLTLTEPGSNARVTFPLHIAGYLHTPYGSLDLEAGLVYNDMEVRASFRTIPWGSINVFIYNFDGILPPVTTSATLTIRDAATGTPLIDSLPITLVGENEAGRVNIYLFNGDQPVLYERRVPTTSIGPNLALSELFWGLSAQETARYQSHIPTPEQIYQYTSTSNPRNALVHVRDLHVNQWGVAMVTLSENMLACSDPDRAARQIQGTLRQFSKTSNIQDVAIVVADQLWQPASSITVTVPPPSDASVYSPPVPTVDSTFYSLDLISPAEGEEIDQIFRIMGNATIPPAGETLRLELKLSTGETIANQVITIGGVPGQPGAFDTEVMHMHNVIETIDAILTISYTNAAGTYNDQHNVRLRPTGSP